MNKTGNILAAALVAFTLAGMATTVSALGSASYSIYGDAIGVAGGPSKSANFSIDGSAMGQFGIGANPMASSAAYSAIFGSAGQLPNALTALRVSASASNNLNETTTSQLSAAPLLDDNTTLAALDPTTVTWSIVNGPIVSISTNGLATAGTVYQDTAATVSATANNLRGQLTLSILNVNSDDLGSYADDGINDSWQVQYFGQDNTSAFPNAEPDGDGETNLSEYRSGTNPIDPNSVVHSARQLNISTRLRVLTGENVLIGGFIVSGTDPKKIMIRGIGPSLSAFGVPGALENPVLELHDNTGAIIAVNDNWKDAPNASEISNSGLAPGNDFESGILQSLPPGSYTVVVRGVGDTTGVGLVEAYDLGQMVPSKFANISTRGFVDIGDNVMIGGFIVGAGLGNNGSGSEKVVVRAIGPSLIPFGVTNALQNPTLELHDGNGNTIALNDNWKEGAQAAEIQASGLAPSDDLESAILQVVPSGAYTAIVRGIGNGAGVGLVEAYNLP